MIRINLRNLLLSLSLATLFSSTASAELKVGVIIPLTGEISFWGQGVKRGLELFEHNHPGKISFIYEDEAYCNSRLAVTAVAKLIQQDKVKVVVASCLSGIKAILPITERNNRLVLAAGFLDDPSADKFDNILSLSAQIGTEAIYAARYLNEKGYKRPTIVRHDDAFTGEFLRVLNKNLNHEVEINDVAISTQTFPWRSQLLKAKKLKSDIYILWLGKDETHSF